MKAWLAKVEAKLVADWREAWRWWSVRLGTLGTAFIAWFVAFPETAIQAWALLPPDLKSYLPAQLVGYVGMGLFVLALVARLVKQKTPEKQ